MKSARSQLQAVADEIEMKALEAHAEGMSLLRRASRLDQLAAIMTDEQAERCLSNLVKEGFVVIVDGVAQMVRSDDVVVQAVEHLNSRGGDA